MNRTLKNVFAALLLAALIAVPALAMAEAITDTAGNVLFEDTLLGGENKLDAMGTGETVMLKDAQVAASALLVGRDITVSGSDIGGSLRAAGYSITATDTRIAANATLAAYSINMAGSFNARGVYAAAATVSFSGECQALTAWGQTVTLNGTVNGSASIYADTVILGENAVVTGELKVQASKPVDIPDGASIGKLTYTQIESTEVETDPEAIAAAAATARANSVIAKLRGLLTAIPGRCVLAVLYFFVMAGGLKKAGAMLTERPVPMLATGLVALIALPLAVLLLLVSVIGTRAGLLIGALATLALGFSLSFTGCAVAQRVLPRMHGLLAAVLGVCAFSVVAIVPYLGGLLRFACMIFTLGYFIQTIYLSWKKPAPAPAEAAPEAPAAPEAEQLAAPEQNAE